MSGYILGYSGLRIPDLAGIKAGFTALGPE
jgi:hypothetical protein